MSALCVAIDLAGSNEPLGNWMAQLADALEHAGTRVVRFATAPLSDQPTSSVRRVGRLWTPLWRQSRGPAIDRGLGPVDVVHVAGRATPPVKGCPLVVSVDDLRPLRDDSRERLRVAQLRRAVARGARLVATSRAAAEELRRALDVARPHVDVVSPAVNWSELVTQGTNLVVSVTGRIDEIVAAAPALARSAERRGARLVVMASDKASQRIKQSGAQVTVANRRNAAAVLRDARVVVHLSDGARFPSFPIAAMAAGVPVVATSTPVNRELMDGAALIVDDADLARLADAMDDAWSNDARRAVLMAAGRSRALDFAPAVCAARFIELYEDERRRAQR